MPRKNNLRAKLLRFPLPRGPPAAKKRRARKGKKANPKARNVMSLFNANREGVWGLLRPVSPYLIVRTTTTISDAKKVHIFCPMLYNDGTYPETWLSWCGVSDVAGSSGINAASNTLPLAVPALDSFITGSAEICPATMTVRIINSNALQTTSGTVYACRCTSNLSLGGRTSAWTTYADAIMGSSRPNVFTAAQLALHPYHGHALPMDMTEAGDFRGATASTLNAGGFTWSSNNIRPAALTPIVVYNPDALTLSYSVTIQWRVRLDGLNPLAAQQIHHPVSPPGLVDRALAAASRSEQAFEIVRDVSEGLSMARVALGGA